MLKIHEYELNTGNGISSLVTEPLTGQIEKIFTESNLSIGEIISVINAQQQWVNNIKVSSPVVK